MADYVIATASTADMPREFYEQHNIPVISYSYMIGDKTFEDDSRESTRESIYKQMRGGALLSTSMINAYTYYDFFKKLMDTGKDVIYLDMSREMSHSFQAAGEAAEKIKKEYPKQRLHVMDTLCISGDLACWFRTWCACTKQENHSTRRLPGAKPTSSRSPTALQ